MHEDSKKYIKNLLDSLALLEPIKTGVAPGYKFNDTIKAVIFDIYGTLLVSASGDIDETSLSVEILKQALEVSEIKITNNYDTSLNYLLEDFEYTIKVSHEVTKQNNIQYPEIDILSIWKIVLFHARRKKLVNFTDDADIKLMTCVFEFLSNKVSPMPGMIETIEALKSREIPLGIISNAQFYTPVLMNYFINNKISLKTKISGFDKDLTIFSYKLGRGKPDLALFDMLIPVLRWKYGLVASEVLFVGNDMLKDIYTGNKAGFKTALFAGDKRSLRMRYNDERTQDVKPDYIIDKIEQVLKIVLP